MMLFHLFQTLPDLLVTIPDGATWIDSLHHGIHISPTDWSLVAQQFETDVFADFRSFFNNFIESGQVWALIIGVIIGYLLRGLTSYG